MMDQKEKFSRAGLKNEYVGEAQHDPHAISSVKEGKVQLLYISPESLLINSEWREMLHSDIYREIGGFCGRRNTLCQTMVKI